MDDQTIECSIPPQTPKTIALYLLLDNSHSILIADMFEYIKVPIVTDVFPRVLVEGTNQRLIVSGDHFHISPYAPLTCRFRGYVPTEDSKNHIAELEQREKDFLSNLSTVRHFCLGERAVSCTSVDPYTTTITWNNSILDNKTTSTPFPGYWMQAADVYDDSEYDTNNESWLNNSGSYNTTVNLTNTSRYDWRKSKIAYHFSVGNGTNIEAL